MHVTIFSNGDLFTSNIILHPDTYVIAVDGGAKHCLKLGIKPEIVIGDFDSLNQIEIQTFKNKGVNLLTYPTAKDETDLELALEYSVEVGATEIEIFGLLGGRWDMSLSNILLLTSPQFNHINFNVEAGKTSIRLLRDGMTLNIYGCYSDRVSLIPLSPEACGIKLRGFEWTLDNENLKLGSQRGISNRIIN
jgi:thiamine pyrophosphokinase